MPWISFKNGYTNCKKKNGTLSKVLPMQRPGNVESPMQTEHPAQKFRGVWAILNGKRKQSKEILLIVLHNSQTKFEPSKLHIPSTLLMTLMTFTSAPNESQPAINNCILRCDRRFFSAPGPYQCDWWKSSSVSSLANACTLHFDKQGCYS